MQAEQTDLVLSKSEDPLRCVHSSRPEPLIRSRPLSDIYPLQNHAERHPVPCLLSGCSAQVQPMTAGPCSDENRLNGINSWSNSVLGQSEGKTYPSRIMRLFSNSKKSPVPAHSPATDCPTSACSNDGGSSPQPWAGFSGLGVVDSFKKLRSSVLQGIQSKAAANNNGDHTANGSGVNITDDTHLLKTEAEGNNVTNRNFTDQIFATVGQYSSDIDDYDEEDSDVNGLTRNSRFSRSIRRAYGAGRIMLHDLENGRRAGSSKNPTVTAQEPCHASRVQTETLIKKTTVRVLNKRSVSSENLPSFKLPVSSKTPCIRPPSPEEYSQRTSLSNGTPNIQRTSSFSSLDLRTCTECTGTSPVKNKIQMLKLIGSMTDLTVRRRPSSSPSPTSPSLMSPLSRLHDDYSRRVPCLRTNERQRRPLPVTAQVSSVEHAPLCHRQPEDDGNLQPSPVVVDPLPLEPTELISSGVSADGETLTSSSKMLNEGPSPSPIQRKTSQHQEQPDDNSLSNEVSQQTAEWFNMAVVISSSLMFLFLSIFIKSKQVRNFCTLFDTFKPKTLFKKMDGFLKY